MATKSTTATKWQLTAIIAGILVICVGAILCWVWCAGTTTTVLLVRHAEKLGAQDKLSGAGIARAQELVHVLEKSGTSAIYHTEAMRTKQTAAPAAAALGVTPTVIDAADTAALVADIKNAHRGETVFVVGHSNTVPQIITALGGPALPDIPENEFDNLFVLSINCRCGGSTYLVNLQYGAVSP